MYKEKLKELRAERKLKQEDVAAILKISRARYTEYENEYDIIPIKHLNTLCNFFNVSFDYIFSFNNIRKYSDSVKEINKELSGKNIKSFRKNENLSQTNLADTIKSSFATIAGYEQGRYYIATPFLYTICKSYHISADYLLAKTNQVKYLQ